MKLFWTLWAEMIEERQDYFKFHLCNFLVNQRTSVYEVLSFLHRIILCASVVDDAQRHLATQNT